MRWATYFLICVLFFQELTAGVKDFKINGIALNDSLLNHFSEQEIEYSLEMMENELKDYEGGQHKKKYSKFFFSEDKFRKLGEYTILEVAFKKNDKKLKAKYVSGMKPVKNKSTCKANREKRIIKAKKTLRAIKINRLEIGSHDWAILNTNGEHLAWMICSDKYLKVSVMYRDYLLFIRKNSSFLK